MEFDMKIDYVLEQIFAVWKMKKENRVALIDDENTSDESCIVEEDEFENDRVDKFVYLDREYIMTCAYNHKFKKWVPLRVVDK
jgi:hypothetical protein